MKIVQQMIRLFCEPCDQDQMRFALPCLHKLSLSFGVNIDVYSKSDINLLCMSLLGFAGISGVRSAECGVRSAECGVRSAECGVRSAECGVWKMRCVENAECGKGGVWKMMSAENVECGK